MGEKTLKLLRQRNNGALALHDGASARPHSALGLHGHTQRQGAPWHHRGEPGLRPMAPSRPLRAALFLLANVIATSPSSPRTIAGVGLEKPSKLSYCPNQIGGQSWQPPENQP
jgi:hypothetical protein